MSDWETKESYDTPGRNVDGMAIIKIDIWNTFDQETKDKWVNELTQVTFKYTHAPLDKVLIYSRNDSRNWGQSGVTGANADFLSRSRTF